MKSSKLALYLLNVMSYEGFLYLWGAKGAQFYTGERTPRFTLDCSGAVTVAAYTVGGPDLRNTHTARMLADEAEPVDIPEAGDLAFYGPGKVIHVMTVIARLPTGEVFVMGPSGGDSTTTTIARAEEQNARCRMYPSHLYRADFLRFGRGLFRRP